jgi:hypothetical protein
MNPDCTIDTFPSMNPRYTAAQGTEEGASAPLEPWHKSALHSMEDYYITDDIREVSSTFIGGYYYPETPLEYIGNAEKMKRYATEQVNKLYGPRQLKKLIGRPTPGLGNLPNPARPDIPGRPTKDWQAFLRVKNFALEGTWGIHIFLGDAPALSDDWFMADNRVGTISILANRELDNCPNCQTHAAQGQLVTGAVSLSIPLAPRSLDVTNTESVVQYLLDNLTWKVAKVL